jgi:beta-galactosidase GanA
MNTIFKKNGKAFFALGGQAHNTSTYSDKELKVFWDALDALGGNVAEIPIYWEAIEPSENIYDFSSLDNIIFQARERNKKLVVLWFGTWKMEP